MSVIWGVKNGKEKGPYWWVYNHNSNESFPTKEYSSIFKPPLWQQALAVLAGIFSVYLLGFDWVSYLLFPCIALLIHRISFYTLQGNISSRRFNDTDECAKIFELLEHKFNEFHHE